MMKKSEINAPFVTTSGINTVVLSYRNKFKVFDFEGDLKNVFYVSSLTELEARELLRKKEDSTFLLHFGSLGKAAWQNMTEGYTVKINPAEAELIERFFNMEIKPRCFESRNEMREFEKTAEEKIILDSVFKIWINKFRDESQCKHIKRIP